jgi:hypothetical protein
MKLFVGIFILSFFTSSIFITGFKDKSRKVASTPIPFISDQIPQENFLTISNVHAKYNKNIITHKPGHDTEYVQRIFGLIIQSASNISTNNLYFPEISIFESYYNFLFSNIVIAEFESKLIHTTFRNANKHCSLTNNIISPLYDYDVPLIYYPERLAQLKSQVNLADTDVKNELENKINLIESRIKISQEINENVPQLIKMLNLDKKENIINCNTITNKDEIQLQLSPDYKRMGIMMLDISEHEEFFKSNNIFDLPRLIKYSSQYLYSLSKKNNTSSELYNSCLGEFKNEKNFKSFLQILNLWKLKNSVNDEFNICQSKEVKRLKKVFRRILEEDAQFTSLYHLYLPRESIERKAFFELIDNVKNGRDNNIYLSLVIKTDYVEGIKGERISPRATVLSVLEDDDVIKFVIPDEVIISEEVQKSSNEEILTQLQASVPHPEKEEFLPELSSLKFTKQKYDHIIIGKKTNLRSSALILRDNYCGNTRYSMFKPIRVKVNSFIERESFYKIEAKDVTEMIQVDKCKKNKFMYVHKSFIKETTKYLELKNGSLSSWVTLRDRPGVSSSLIVGTYGPSNIVITNEVIKNDKYLWIEILTVDGETAWFYAGLISNKKVEYL